MMTHCTADLRYGYVSRAYADMIGRPPESITGCPIRDVLGEKNFEQIRSYVERVLRGEHVRYEVDLDLPTLGRRWLDVTYVPEKNDAGKIIGWIASILDITARRAAENALREADRRKDEFLATLAHELRNPLAPLRTGLEILLVQPGDAARVEQTRSIMERQLLRLVRLVDDLLDVSRINQGKITLARTNITLASVIQDAVETSRPMIQAGGHRFTAQVPGETLCVVGDQTRLAQVIGNLLNNAAKFTPYGGQIWLTAERQGSDAVVSVRDNGIGIVPSLLPTVFDLFTQGDQSFERTHSGLGIGLSLARQFVEMHGGSIEARSSGEGAGSEFVVRLPLDLTQPMPSAPSTDAVTPIPSRSGARILVADDNVDAAKNLSRLLNLLGHETRTAHDGQAAVELAEEFRPEVIVLDIGMPRLNGYEAAMRIRQAPWGREVTLVALTGWGADEDIARAHAAGFDHHVVKPVGLETLRKLLDEAKVPVQPVLNRD